MVDINEKALKYYASGVQ